MPPAPFFICPGAPIGAQGLHQKVVFGLTRYLPLPGLACVWINSERPWAGPAGTLLDHASFRRRVWLKAAEAKGLHEVHFHDLRHTGNMLTAEAGATLRELMDRMGHSSTRAALVYLHATSQRQGTHR